jgi:hypothetical protein
MASFYHIFLVLAPEMQKRRKKHRFRASKRKITNSGRGKQGKKERKA